MDQFIIEAISRINIAELMAIGIMMAVMFARSDKKRDDLEKRLTEKIDRVEKRLTDRINGIEVRLESVEKKILDLDRCLCRIEGALHAKECCLLAKDHIFKKAE